MICLIRLLDRKDRHMLRLFAYLINEHKIFNHLYRDTISLGELLEF